MYSDCKYEWTLTDESGKEMLSLKGKMKELLTEKCRFSNPELWWTHDHGNPYLYQSSFKLGDVAGNILDEKTQKVGFRRVRLVMNEGAWNEPKEFPKTRSVPPAQFKLNGRNIFAKGTNWVNPEIFPGTITIERYKELLDIAVDTNFNVVRTWGGSIVNKEYFFEICDELGILVWQEFPLSCNLYPDEPHYLSILEQEALSIVKRLRKHACIGLWCGGNELFNNWSGMTDQSLVLRLLNRICLQYDFHTPFIPTSPLFGMGHGNYVFKWKGKDVFEFMNESRNTAYTEFGMPGVSPREVLEKIIPQEDLFPPKYNTAWEAHHALNSWDADVQTWLCYKVLNQYFGEAQSLDELIEQSQLLQSEGYKAIYEEARRKKPYCSMALNWCFNEPWPAAANNSLIAYPAVEKPALKEVRNSCRPLCASARFSKFVWNEGEYFFTDIWLLNDRFEEIKPMNIVVKIQAGSEETIILKWQSFSGEANVNIEGPTARFKLPKWNINSFKVLVEVEGKPEYNSEYTLMYQKKKEVIVKKTAMMNV
jgi:beta-mannosidase